MNEPERNVTAALVIEEMCIELHMTEERLLIHLALENIHTLSEKAQRRIAFKSRVYTEQGIYQIRPRRR